VKAEVEGASQWVHLGLSPREWQLLMRVSNGLTNEAIADQLNLSVGTVKNQLTKIYRKLGVSGRAAATSRFKGAVEEAIAG
jgi:DNA-binding NarL/FixJ family response regulator